MTAYSSLPALFLINSYLHRFTCLPISLALQQD